MTPLTSLALQSDNQRLIHVQSNSFHMEYKKGLATYVSNVIADQGSRHLTGDKLIIHRNSAGKIDAMTAHGKPAHIKLLPKPTSQWVTGNALTIIFKPLENKLILLKNAHLTQGSNSFKGEKLTYDTATEVVDSPQTKAGRSELILQPINPTTHPKKVKHAKPTDR